MNVHGLCVFIIAYLYSDRTMEIRVCFTLTQDIRAKSTAALSPSAVNRFATSTNNSRTWDEVWLSERMTFRIHKRCPWTKYDWREWRTSRKYTEEKIGKQRVVKCMRVVEGGRMHVGYRDCTYYLRLRSYLALGFLLIDKGIRYNTMQRIVFLNYLNSSVCIF